MKKKVAENGCCGCLDVQERKNHRNKDFQFWLQHSHPVALTTQDMLHQRINYTHQNPVRAGFVAEAHHWIWSSARAYAEIEKSKVDLTMV
ncbi:hypothetical protein WAF17_11370 [Bernardetia sp. ABR2-2B]|uniref:hypothetical protein n=1 Tax=Bernardetia sp. ABR2-2B TaxID=3127472 RepID=UPI0030CED299